MNPKVWQSAARHRSKISFTIKTPTILILSLMLSFTGFVNCGSNQKIEIYQPVTPDEFDREYTVTKLKSDVKFLVQTLEAVHPDLYAYTSRESFIEECQRIELQLNSPLTRIEFYFKVAPLVAMLKDGHTKVYPVYEEYYHHLQQGGLLFPLDVDIQDRSTFVTANYSSDSIPAPGSELLTINGLKTSTIIEELLPLISGERLEKRLDYLSSFHFYRHFLWLKYPSSEMIYNLTFIPEYKKEIQKLTLSGVTYQEIMEQKDSQDSKEEQFSYHTLLDGSTGLLEITLFPGNQKSFENFLERVFGDLKQKEIRNLIIDIRDNGGGYSPAAMELLRYLTDKPLSRIPRMDIKVSSQIKNYYRRESLPKIFRWFPQQWFHPTWRKIWGAPEGSVVTVSTDPKKMDPTPLRFDGHIYVLIGRGTFSTATMFATYIKDYSLGELVGQETGGLATSFGAFYPFRLPNTRLLVRVSHKRIYRPSGEDTGRGVMPDHPVTYSQEDLAKEADPVLDYAIELILKQ